MSKVKSSKRMQHTSEIQRKMYARMHPRNQQKFCAVLLGIGGTTKAPILEEV